MAGHFTIKELEFKPTGSAIIDSSDDFSYFTATGDPKAILCRLFGEKGEVITSSQINFVFKSSISVVSVDANAIKGILDFFNLAIIYSESKESSINLNQVETKLVNTAQNAESRTEVQNNTVIFINSKVCFVLHYFSNRYDIYFNKINPKFLNTNITIEFIDLPTHFRVDALIDLLCNKGINCELSKTEVVTIIEK